MREQISETDWINDNQGSLMINKMLSERTLWQVLISLSEICDIKSFFVRSDLVKLKIEGSGKSFSKNHVPSLPVQAIYARNLIEMRNHGCCFKLVLTA